MSVKLLLNILSIKEGVLFSTTLEGWMMYGSSPFELSNA